MWLTARLSREGTERMIADPIDDINTHRVYTPFAAYPKMLYRGDGQAVEEIETVVVASQQDEAGKLLQGWRATVFPPVRPSAPAERPGSAVRK
jgi:hypothetical protein